MRVIEAAVEARKVQVLQQDTWETTAKTYSFPVDTHLTQLTIQVTNYKTNDSILVGIRNPEGRQSLFFCSSKRDCVLRLCSPLL